MRFVRRPGAREERSEVRERARRCRRRSLGRRSLSPRGRGLAPRGGGLDALMVTAPLGPSPRAGLRSPLPSRRSATGGRARRGSGRGRRRRVIRNRAGRAGVGASFGIGAGRAGVGASFGIGAGRSPDVGATGCAGAGRAGAVGAASGAGSGVTACGVGTGSGCGGAALETLASDQQKCGQRDDTEGGGPQEDAREAEATRRLPHPGLRLQDGWPSSWPVSQL